MCVSMIGMVNFEPSLLQSRAVKKAVALVREPCGTHVCAPLLHCRVTDEQWLRTAEQVAWHAKKVV